MTVSLVPLSATSVDVAPQLPNGARFNWSCTDSQGVGTCQLGALSVIMRNAMIALYVITVYLGFGVNQVGAYINCQCVHLRPLTILTITILK